MKKTTILIFILSHIVSFSQFTIPISATTTATNITGNLKSVYNQNGILNSDNVQSNHKPPTLLNSFACSCTLPTFVFSFGTSTEVDGISLWNAGFNNSSIFTDDGVNHVKFYYSNDAINYTLIQGGDVFFKQNIEITKITDEIKPQIISFKEITATHIKMEVLSTFNNTYTAFSEIAFSKNGVLSLNEYKNELIELFPNPASDLIKIKGTIISNSFEIYNILGNVVLKGITEKEIDISNLKKGIYFIKLEKGKTLKFLKK